MGERNVRNRGNRRTSPEREEDEMSESLHSALVENLFDEEEALLNLHMNVIQGTYVRVYVCVCVCVYIFIYLASLFSLCLLKFEKIMFSLLSSFPLLIFFLYSSLLNLT